MDKNSSSNQEVKDKEPVQKDASTSPIPQKQDNRTVVQLKNIDFVPIQPLLPPSHFAVPRYYSKCTIIEIPPNNVPRYLQFYQGRTGHYHDFFQRVL